MYTRIYKKIRLGLLPFLVFCFLLNACSNNDDNKKTDSIATQTLVRWKAMPDYPHDSLEQWLNVYLAIGNTTNAMLVNKQSVEEGIILIPLTPFTPGLKYEIRVKDEIVGNIQIPATAPAELPEVFAIYPTTDTVPENLLKIYIEFTRPMQEGNALKYIKLVRNERDTVPDIFLDLQPELWNKESTILTLWLDPGRIKRDLQPNLKLGPPLKKGEKYQLVIEPGWPDKQGASWQHPYIKNIIPVSRDSISPDPARWTIKPAKPDTDEAIEVFLYESLDYMLLNNAIHVTDDKGNDIQGEIYVNAKERSFDFTPSFSWKKGNYILEIEPRLEDLAGNNLNRPFDNDLTQKQQEQKEVFKKAFQIR